jgi:hypothetical protein
MGSPAGPMRARRVVIPEPSSFKYPRKAGAQLIRDASDAETTAVYLSYARTSRDPLLEIYSNRNFARLDVALADIEPAIVNNLEVSTASARI